MRPSRRVVVAGVCATIAATAGWLSLARGSTPVVAPATPIQHLVVIFDENESFDHYFGTYPNATNPPGEPAFTAAAGTPAVDGLTAGLLNANPNSANPARIDRANALTCDQDHNYADEQKAFDNGLMDKFVEFTAGGAASCTGPRGQNIVMDYFDGNTVTGLWNLAQHFTMSDSFYGSTFGPSTPGALNLIAGTTHGVTPAAGENGTMINDPNPELDDCQTGNAQMSGKNIGDLMNTAGVTWGWFQGGFRPSAVAAGHATCATGHNNIGGAAVADYSAHHEPFMYYASTTNPHHLPPSSTAAIGHDDRANHQYDLLDFDAAVRANNLPQVSFLKAASFEDAHPGYSDPLDEQHFVARTLDELEQSPDWDSTAVVIAYDDSDGWYDHRQVVSQHSNAASDQAICNGPPGDPVLLDRCGPGPRLPLLVISPWVRPNSVDSTQIEQASIIRFIEDNWGLGQLPAAQKSFDSRATSLTSLFDFNPGDPRAPKVYLDPSTGQTIPSPPSNLGSSPDYPTPTPTATATVTVTPTPTATPPPPKPKFKPTVSVRAKRHGKRLTLALKVSHVNTKLGRVTVSVKLRRKGKTVASSASHRVRSGKVTIVLKAKHALKKGRYTLSVRVKQGRSSKTLTKRLTVH